MQKICVFIDAENTLLRNIKMNGIKFLVSKNACINQVLQKFIQMNWYTQ